MNESVERCRDYAKMYRELGYNPIPSRSDRKGPAVSEYAKYRDGEGIPDEWIQHWWTPNVQLATGAAWRLMVIDIDGEQALFQWEEWVDSYQERIDTWYVETGGGGRHVYFRLPDWLPRFPSRRIWGQWDPIDERWVRHRFIEILADKKLAIAPPSRHVDTGLPYRFLDGYGPFEIGRPAPAPDWLLWMPAMAAPGGACPCEAEAIDRPARTCAGTRRYNACDVLRAIPPDTKIALARSWGMRFVSERWNESGWVPCHAYDRPDNHPSASFNVSSGYYFDHANGTRMSLFDLAAELGAYATWIDALHEFGAKYITEEV